MCGIKFLLELAKLFLERADLFGGLFREFFRFGQNSAPVLRFGFRGCGGFPVLHQFRGLGDRQRCRCKGIAFLSLRLSLFFVLVFVFLYLFLNHLEENGTLAEGNFSLGAAEQRNGAAVVKNFKRRIAGLWRQLNLAAAVFQHHPSLHPVGNLQAKIAAFRRSKHLYDAAAAEGGRVDRAVRRQADLRQARAILEGFTPIDSQFCAFTTVMATLPSKALSSITLSIAGRTKFALPKTGFTKLSTQQIYGMSLG